MLRTLLFSVIVTCAVLPVLQAESVGVAQTIAAQALNEQAQDHPQAAHVRALAQGLRDGSVSLAEAEQVMRLLSFASGQAGQASGQAAAAARSVPRQDPRDVLGLLDEQPAPRGDQAEDPTAVAGPGQLPAAEEASIADLEAWAGTRSPGLPDVDEAAEPPPDDDRLDMPASDALGRLRTDDLPQEERVPDEDAAPESASAEPEGPAPAQPALAQASPTMRSDQADLAAIDGQVRMVEQRESGDRTMTMVILDQGEQHGLENGHRLRVQRNGEGLVLLTVFDVRDRISVAVVLDGSWKVEADEREIRIGDQVVRDQ